MRLALAGMEGDGALADLAEDLAMLRVAAGKRVLLVGPRAGHYDVALYDDVVSYVVQAGQDGLLAQADVILALLRPQELERDGAAALRARLHQAQCRNPAARLLVTVAHGRRPLTAHQAGCLLVFVAELAHARLADTLVLADGEDNYHSRHSELELPAYKEDCKLCAAEVRHLYRAIFRPLSSRDG